MIDTEPSTIYYNGIKYVMIDNDGRYDCEHAFVEEVDYAWFQSIDGKKLCIPEGEMPPAVICAYDKNRMKGCHGRCGNYIQIPIVEEDDEEEGNCDDGEEV